MLLERSKVTGSREIQTSTFSLTHSVDMHSAVVCCLWDTDFVRYRIYM